MPTKNKKGKKKTTNWHQVLNTVKQAFTSYFCKSVNRMMHKLNTEYAKTIF